MSLTADQVIETFNAATEENQLSPLRHEQVIQFPADGEVWVAADMHDHRTNFNKLLAASDLGNNPQRHLILQELIHGDHIDVWGAEDSWKTLARAAELKCDFPNQVHFLLANHDLAQIHGEGIVKSGKNVCESFTLAIKRDFGPDRYNVTIAIQEFMLSFPLAARSPNGVFFCHSLPTDKQIESFDYTVFNRPLAGPDYARKVGPVYQLIWGRGATPTGADMFAQRVQAKFLITGHQPQDMGYGVNGDKHLIIASDHNQGVFAMVDFSTEYTMDALVERLTKFVSLDV